jgi:hypothetical protein
MLESKIMTKRVMMAIMASMDHVGFVSVVVAGCVSELSLAYRRKRKIFQVITPKKGIRYMRAVGVVEVA